MKISINDLGNIHRVNWEDIGGIHHDDWADAYISYAEWKNGDPLTDDEIEQLNENYDFREFFYADLEQQAVDDAMFSAEMYRDMKNGF